VGAMLIFFHYSLSWTREEVLELVSPAADVGPEGIDHPLLFSTSACSMYVSVWGSYSSVILYRGSFNTSLVFN